jgi:hypothetical protein
MAALPKKEADKFPPKKGAIQPKKAPRAGAKKVAAKGKK